MTLKENIIKANSLVRALFELDLIPNAVFKAGLILTLTSYNVNEEVKENGE